MKNLAARLENPAVPSRSFAILNGLGSQYFEFISVHKYATVAGGDRG